MLTGEEEEVLSSAVTQVFWPLSVRGVMNVSPTTWQIPIEALMSPCSLIEGPLLSCWPNGACRPLMIVEPLGACRPLSRRPSITEGYPPQPRAYLDASLQDWNNSLGRKKVGEV